MNMEETVETTVSEQSPLAATLERIAARDKYLAAYLLPAVGAGWMRASDLVTLDGG